MEGIGGGFYKVDGELLLGYYPAATRPSEQPPSSEVPSDMQLSILETARTSAGTRMPSEKILTGGGDIFLIEAAPIDTEKSSWGSAWTVERMPRVQGSNRLRAYLITVALGIAALVCVILTLLVVRNLQMGVKKIESSLQDLESDLSSQIPTGSDPEEIERIAQAINRLGTTLRENIDREKQIELEAIGRAEAQSVSRNR
jgi:methyl-accepting chemotaxis protein